MKVKISRKYTILWLIIFSVIGLNIIVLSLDDRIVYGKSGRLFFLPEISILTDFFVKPIKSDHILKYEKIEISRYTKGLSCSGLFKVQNKSVIYKDSCELLIFPKLEQPYIEIKLPQENYFDKKKSFKIYPFQKAYLAPYLGNLLNSKMNLIHLDYKYLLLDYENIEHPYFIREKYNGDLIEKQKVSNGIHFKLQNNTEQLLLSSIKSNNDQVRNNITTKVNKLNDIIKNNTFEQLNEIFDFNYLAQYFIYSNITGRNQFSNCRWVYRMTNGKIYPIATSHNTFKKFNVDREPIWRLLLKNDSFRVKLNDWISISKNLPNDKEIKTILNKYGANLSNYKENIKITQRELNFRLRKDAVIMINNKNKLKEFIKGMMTNNSKNMHLKIDKKTATLIENLGFIINKSKIIIPKGTYKIENDIILPEGYELIINAGAELYMGENVSIVVNDELHVIGTKQEKVIIKGDRNAPFGTIASIGYGTQNSTVEYLEISYGSEAMIDGKYLTGALCFYHQNVTLTNLECHSNCADDGLNVKYGNIEIKNSNFFDNLADKIDLDFCTGLIDNCYFSCSNGDINGDGLDLSGSNISINNSHFNKFKDKGVSVGEKSIATVKHSYFNENNNAISIKDLSMVRVINNLFRDNRVVFNLYMKKRIFGGGTLNLMDNAFERNLQKIKKDSVSNVYQ